MLHAILAYGCIYEEGPSSLKIASRSILYHTSEILSTISVNNLIFSNKGAQLLVIDGILFMIVVETSNAPCIRGTSARDVDVICANESFPCATASFTCIWAALQDEA